MRAAGTRLWMSGFVVLLLLVSGCGSDDGDEAGGSADPYITIVASTSIIGALAGAVAGERAEVIVLIGPGIDTHTFETTPGDARKIGEADIVLINGLGLDDFLIDDVVGANSDAAIVTVTDHIELLTGDHEHEEADHDHEDGEASGDEPEHEDKPEDEAGHEREDDEHEHGEFDPHVWQDPLRVKIMVDTIADALSELDPENAGEYRANAGDYNATLDETHAEIQELIDAIPPENRKLVTNHDAFAYFAERYGLEVVGTVIPGTSSESDPSAGELAELAELIRELNVKAIFAEQLIDARVAEQLADDTGVQIVYGLYTEQVGDAGSGVETVHEMLEANAELISNGLR